MNRRTAIATASAISLAAVAGAFAAGANLGILGFRSGEPAGKLSPVGTIVSATPSPEKTVVVNEDVVEPSRSPEPSLEPTVEPRESETEHLSTPSPTPTFTQSPEPTDHETESPEPHDD